MKAKKKEKKYDKQISVIGFGTEEKYTFIYRKKYQRSEVEKKKRTINIHHQSLHSITIIVT